MYSNEFSLSFPGLGIDWFDLNKVAFTLFGKVEVRWYGIVITCGIFFAFLYAMWRGKRNEGVVPDDVIDVGLFTVFGGVLGARLYYVLTTLDVYEYDSFYDVIAIWEGGLAIYGGIIGGCLGILLACKLKKLKWRKLFDMIAPGVVIAQALGRWGNFFNGEAYGYEIGETTRFYFFNKEFVLNSGEGTLFHTLRMGLHLHPYSSYRGYFHPTFFYESLWNVAGFFLLNLLYKKKKFDGQIALLYFMWYGFGRMFIEGLRTDSLYIPGTTLRISQCVGLLCFLVGTGLLVFFLLRERKQAAPELLLAVESTAENLSTSMAEEIAEATAEAEEAPAEKNEPITEEEDHGNSH